MMKIEISKIKINPGRRKISPKGVEDLAESMAVVGLMFPVILDRDYNLIAGLHRLEAAKSLGWTEIDCTVCKLEGLQAELAEIDENFVRTELSDPDRRTLLVRRKELYESLHPEKRHGGDRRSENFKSSNCRDERVKSFVEDTAEKWGVSPRTVERRLWVAEHMTPAAHDIIQDSDYRITHQEAEKLARLMPEQQRDAAIMLTSRQIKSVDEYRPDGTGDTSPALEKPAVDKSVELFWDYSDFTKTILRRLEEFHDVAGEFQKLPPEQYKKFSNETDSVVHAMWRFLAQVKALTE